MKLPRAMRGPFAWILLAIVLLFVLLTVVSSAGSPKVVPLSTVQQAVQQDKVASAVIDDSNQNVTVTTAPGQTIDGATKVQANYTNHYDSDLYQQLSGHVRGSVKVDVSHPNVFLSILVNFGPFLLVAIIFWVFLTQMQGGGGRVMQFGRARAKLVSKDTPKTTFADVAGVDEAIEELQEIKEFLENPAKFQAIGAKIPKGVLLYGPPGTGKTLLARAVAGEAGVPFYSISGSDFVEMFVGVGASRVRDLFEQAKSNAPAIIFVDEIDAVGRHRGAGLGGGHDEREQTLNQMLVEMDGFDVNRGVILIAATNRPDILDPALLRPGRFDRQIVVDRPDLEGRKAILRVHAKGKPFATDVDLDVIARRTPGFTGADLANVINEAALLTARTDARQITTSMLEESIDRVMAGPTRKSRVMSDKEKKVTAYHEGGHALVAYALPNTDPVHKVTIVSRGRALGYTMVLPTEDRHTQTRSEMMDSLAYALGGRAAEELVFQEPTTGASNDIEKATSVARAMVMQYGMSDAVGAIRIGQPDHEVFLGRDMANQRDYSEQVAAEVDGEVRRLIEQAHDEAWDILVEYRDVLDNLVLRLLDKETVGKDELAEIFESVEKRPARSYAPIRVAPSYRPPVLTAGELALLGPADVAGLEQGSSRSRSGRGRSGGNGNGSRTANGRATTRAGNGRASNGKANGKAAEPAGQARRTAKRSAAKPSRASDAPVTRRRRGTAGA